MQGREREVLEKLLSKYKTMEEETKIKKNRGIV